MSLAGWIGTGGKFPFEGHLLECSTLYFSGRKPLAAVRLLNTGYVASVTEKVDLKFYLIFIIWIVHLRTVAQFVYWKTFKYVWVCESIFSTINYEIYMQTKYFQWKFRVQIEMSYKCKIHIRFEKPFYEKFLINNFLFDSIWKW